jgi:hypothetical protein
MKGKTFLLHICENFKKRCLTLEGTELVGAGNKTNGFNTTMVSMPSPAPEFQVLETYFSKSCGFFFFCGTALYLPFESPSSPFALAVFQIGSCIALAWSWS